VEKLQALRNCSAAVKRNVFGTWNMVQAAEECGAKSAATLFHFKPQSPVDIPLRQAVEA